MSRRKVRMAMDLLAGQCLNKHLHTIGIEYVSTYLPRKHQVKKISQRRSPVSGHPVPEALVNNVSKLIEFTKLME